VKAPEDTVTLAGSGARLLLRTGATALLWTFHAGHKIVDFASESSAFPDPLGVGHATSLLLALSVESFCGLLVALGLLTRLACIPVVATMLVVLKLALSGAGHADVQAACLYGIIYGSLIALGPGRFSLDHVLATRRARARAAVPNARSVSY